MQKGLLCASALLLFVGCATPAGPGKCRVKVVTSTTPQVNLDRQGNSLPTTVRFFELKGVDKLKNAGFSDAWEAPKQALGDSLLESHEYVVYPEQKHTETVLINDEATHVAAVAVFREPEGTDWRAYAKLPPMGTVERCREDEPGGPLYLLLAGNDIKASNKPFDEQ